jgi:cyclophilin family peptidyl-prolyl cis-trans isomerase
VYIDIGIGGRFVGTIYCEIYANIVPKTAENFVTFVNGYSTNLLGHQGYKGTRFHRIIPGFMIQGGDFTKGNGTGGFSIYGETFDDESFRIKHDKAGLLSMANSGPNTNGSQFFITTVPVPHLNNKHVVFGQVIKGMDIVKQIELLGTQDGTPQEEVTIMNCGTK